LQFTPKDKIEVAPMMENLLKGKW